MPYGFGVDDSKALLEAGLVSEEVIGIDTLCGEGVGRPCPLPRWAAIWSH